jgi:competence protein ComFC
MYGIINKTNVQNVKNTMIDSLLSLVSPHLCYACGTIGALRCDNCKYDITSEGASQCFICKSENKRNGSCANCPAAFTHSWIVGEREGVLKKLVNDYKFENVKAAHKDLAELLSASIGQLPSNTVVVAVPTIASHIRQRGYDHAALLAKSFARQQGLKYKALLARTDNTVQRGASRQLRDTQARTAFKASSVQSSSPYLVIDDIVTTGATLEHASRALLGAGAREVWAAAICAQPLD